MAEADSCDLQDESCIWWDEAGIATLAICVVAARRQLSYQSHYHLSTYPVMVRVDFSPRLIPPSALMMPSSQPMQLS
jgi:hypothetical protein